MVDFNEAHEGKEVRVEKLSTNQIIRHAGKTGGPTCTYSVLPYECECGYSSVIHLWDVSFIR